MPDVPRRPHQELCQIGERKKRKSLESGQERTPLVSERQLEITETLGRGFGSCYERCVSKPPKSCHLKIIPSAFSTR
jgi:hypothetical protein